METRSSHFVVGIFVLGAYVLLDNLLPLLIECVENDVTIGEVCDTLREERGEYRGEG